MLDTIDRCGRDLFGALAALSNQTSVLGMRDGHAQTSFTLNTKGCYQYAKFDSDPERKLAIILEKDSSVRLWMKPGPNQFKIFDNHGAPYQPDFVVETNTGKLIIEVKRQSEMTAAEVLRKADAASLWCHVATQAGAKSSEKPWHYLLVPESEVQENFTVSGLEATRTRAPDTDLLSRYIFEDADSKANTAAEAVG